MAIDWAPVHAEPEVEPLTPGEFLQIAQLSHHTFGLVLRAGKEEMVAARLRRLVLAGRFPCYGEYCRYVAGDATGAALAAMIDALATNHTYFLREPDNFKFLRACVVPQLARRDAIEVWCAACSTGEESWTIACILSDAAPFGRFHVRSTDISRKALEFAKRAWYPASRCAELPPEWLRQFFVEDQGGYRVCARLREQASFDRLNLIGQVGCGRRFPIIFCRNVMIYFDVATHANLVRKLTDCLEPGGYLFTGHAESLNGIPHGLEYVRPAVYRRPGRFETKR